jgi:hypothetical protein
MPIRIAPLAVAGALALTMIGASPAFAESPHHDVVVTATADHHLHLRTHLSAGVVEFHVRGSSGESLQLARPKHGAGAQQLVADGNLLNTKGDASALEHDFLAVGGVSTGHTLWVRLRPGTYYAIDTSSPTGSLDQVVTLHVRGYDPSERMARASATITAIHEMTWAKHPSWIPSHGVLRFVNASSDYHFVELAKLTRASTTLAQLKQGLQQQDRSLFDQSGLYDTGVLSPGMQQESTYRLPRGTYALLCWWPGTGGMPHALMGMVRIIHVG